MVIIARAVQVISAGLTRLAALTLEQCCSRSYSQRRARALAGERRRETLGSIVELFDEKSFALLFILLLGVSALPLPTGGATHVFEIVAMLLEDLAIVVLAVAVGVAGVALELILGRAAVHGISKLF